MRFIKTLCARSSTIAVAVLVVSVAARPTGAQEPRRLAQPDSVPTELAAALATAGGFSTAPQILVGAIPEWVINKVSLPSAARVVGSAFIGTTVVGVVSVAEAPAAAIAEAKSVLLAHGWTNPPARPTMQFGGFRQAPTVSQAAVNATRVTVCSGDDMLAASAASEQGTTTRITYRLSPATGICRAPVAAVQFQPAAPLAMPTLVNPPSGPEASSAAQCLPSIGMGGNLTMTTLDTPLSPDALLDHYAKQLADSGWTAAGDKITGRTWTRTDSAGVPVEVSLEIKPAGNNSRCREATMQVRQLRKP